MLLLYSCTIPVVLMLAAGCCQAGKFWHISDLHLDYEYDVQGNATNKCHKNLNSTSSSSNSSSSADTVLGPAGDYRCDAPQVLVRSILQAMKNLEPNPDFIVWTGDNGPHNYNPTPSFVEIMRTQKMVFSELEKLFPGKPVIAALGNHDSDPPDSYPLLNDTITTAENGDNSTENENATTSSQYYKYYSQGGFDSQLLNNEAAKSTFLKCGYYYRTIQDSEGLTMRFLVLNTNVYYYNKAVIEGSDPCGQLAFMNQTFSSLGPQEKLFIVAHVPPGSFERNPGTSFFNYNGTPNDIKYGPELEKNYVSLVVDPEVYEHIHAHLYGHTHTDSFRLFLSRTGDDQVRGVGFVASSGTPLVGHKEGTNPGMRLYSYDGQSGTLMDYNQYGLDIKKLNLDNLTQQTDASDILESTTPPPDQVDDATTVQTDTENQTMTVDESQTKQNQTLLLGHMGENPTPSNNKTLLGHMGENPTAPENQTIPENSPNSTLLGHEGENPMVAKLNPLDDSSKNDTDAAVIGSIASKFSLIYNASSAYGVHNLTAEEMGWAYNQMDKNSKTFNYYFMHNTNNHMNGVSPCDDVCYRNHMCTIKNQIIEELNSCISDTNRTLKVVIHQEVENPVIVTTDDAAIVNKSSFAPIPAVPLTPQTTSASKPLIPLSNSTATTMQPPIAKPELPIGKDSPGHDAINADGVSKTASTQTSSQVAGIILGAAGAILVFVLCGIAMRKYRQRRYRDQEFLLTDSVFRYDGYNQLDDGF